MLHLTFAIAYSCSAEVFAVEGPDDDEGMLLVPAYQCMLTVCLDDMPDDHKSKGTYPFGWAYATHTGQDRRCSLPSVYATLLMLGEDNAICKTSKMMQTGNCTCCSFDVD